MSSGCRLVVVDNERNRVSVVGVDGVSVRHVGAAVLNRPSSAVCTALDELVVVDAGNGRLVVFDATGEMLLAFGIGEFNAATIREDSIFAQRCAHGTVESERLVFTP